jgi:hypothetical protein
MRCEYCVRARLGSTPQARAAVKRRVVRTRTAAKSVLFYDNGVRRGRGGYVPSLGNRGNWWGLSGRQVFCFVRKKMDAKLLLSVADHLPMLQRMSDTAVLTVVSALYAIAVFVLKRRRA